MTALKARDALTPMQRREKSGRIAGALLAHPWYLEAKQLLVYASYRSEAETEAIIRSALAAGKQVYCPAVTGKREMVFCALENALRDAVLEHGLVALPKSGLGIPEPDVSACRHYRYEPPGGLMIMPGTAFDKEGNRIGYGGGFYDSFLLKYPMRTVGIFFDCQKTPERIACEEHDVRPDRILTESGWMEPESERCNKKDTEIGKLTGKAESEYGGNEYDKT